MFIKVTNQSIYGMVKEQGLLSIHRNRPFQTGESQRTEAKTEKLKKKIQFVEGGRDELYYCFKFFKLDKGTKLEKIEGRSKMP